MAGPSSIESCARELSANCRGDVTLGLERAAEFARDFGGIVRRTPSLVFRPDSIDSVAKGLAIAREHGVAVATRGAGHSQSGQCTGRGILFDMRGLNRVVGVSENDALIEVEAGTTWRAIVDASFRQGLLPCGLTHVLDTTIAGTLSVAGVGSETWRFGPQVDNVAYLDVATLEGDVVRASSSENRTLFDAVRAGLGQLGVIVRAGYPLRRCRRRIQSRYFLYRSSERFMRDVESVCAGSAGSFVSGMIARDVRNPRAWILLLVVGVEHDGELSDLDGSWVKRLDCDAELPSQDVPLWNEAGLPGHLFFRIYAPAPGSLEANPTTLRPWVDHIFSREAAQIMLDELLSARWPMLSLGTAVVIFIRRGPQEAPLFRVPDADLGWGVGMFPSVPPTTREAVLELMNSYSRHGCDLGGKRYLSGFVDFNGVQAWQEHYGPAWPAFLACKQRFDPTGILNPGFIQWD